MNIKKKIIEKVNDINDPQLLAELMQAIELEHDIEHFHQLTIDEKVAIDEGIEDAESGNLHSNSEASQLVKKWLKK
jgi:predicted transcriptional regulator